MLRLGLGTVGTVVSLLLVTNCGTQAQTMIGDNFESGSLSTARWYLRQTVPEALAFDTSAPREGKQSLIVGVNEAIETCEHSLAYSLIDAPSGSKNGQACPGNSGLLEEKRCQRNEIRVAKPLQRTFGEDLWYGFSFKVRGQIPACGSARWVVGQWKHSSGDSPFLAQRFDNGVFHISIQDGHCRCRITTAPGDPDAKALRLLDEPLRCINSQENSPEEGKTCKSGLKVKYGSSPSLPNPSQGWVDMVYRVRGGERGLVEIYVGDRFIAKVTGRIGYSGGSGDRQYFKIGNYRAFIPGQAELLLDRFWRGKKRRSP